MKIDRTLLVTGFPLIDEQHERYADLVDRFFLLAAQGNVARQALSKEMREVIKPTFPI